MQQRQLLRLPPGGGLDEALAGQQFATAGKKHQSGAGAFGALQPVLLEGADHLVFQPLLRPRKLVQHLHRPAAPFALDQRGPRQSLLQRLTVEGGRHEQQPQIRPQQLAGLAQQSQGQIGLGASLMELVEDDAGHPLQSGVFLELAQEKACGEHLQPRATGDPALQSHAIADPLADAFAQFVRQAQRRVAGRQPARFQHQQASLIAQPLQQRQRYTGGLPGAGGRLQHQHRPLRSQGLGHRLQMAVDRQLAGGALRHQRTWRLPSTGW